MYKKDLALNSQKWLTCIKSNQTKLNQTKPIQTKPNPIYLIYMYKDLALNNLQ